MPRELNKLVALSLNRLPCPPHSPTGEQRSKLYSDGAGLWLQVTSEGARTWLFRFRHSGRTRAMGLGPLHTVSLAEARLKARVCRQLVLDGIDPIEARKAKRIGEQLTAAKTLTFQQAAERYIAAHAAGWQNAKHAAQWPSTLEAYVYPALGALPVQAIDRPAVLRVLAPIWAEKPETAGRVRGRIESVLGWATQHGYREGANPATWKGVLEHALPAKRKVRSVKHLAAVPYADLPAFMSELHQQPGMAACALEFAILTAARTGEVIGSTWPEIDAAARLWTIPANRMKAGREHRVPLSEPALMILAGLERAGSRIFPITDRAMRKLLKRQRPGITVHGFRSTFKDWATEQTTFRTEAIELALAHAVGNAVEAAYRRGDLFEKRRQLAEAWGTYCAGNRVDKVVQLRRGPAGLS
jgi:integrase